MSRYKQLKFKTIRRLGELPGFTTKIPNKKFRPGHQDSAKSKPPVLESEYIKRLHEKQKLRFNYGISEKQLYSYVRAARQLKGLTGVNLLKLLEMRLDNIIYRLNFSPNIRSARQIISHGHIYVNEKKITIPSFQCKHNDIIRLKTNTSILQHRNSLTSPNLLGNFLTVDKKTSIGKIQRLVTRSDINKKFNESLVIEFYSRK